MNRFGSTICYSDLEYVKSCHGSEGFPEKPRQLWTLRLWWVRFSSSVFNCLVVLRLFSDPFQAFRFYEGAKRDLRSSLLAGRFPAVSCYTILVAAYINTNPTYLSSSMKTTFHNIDFTRSQIFKGAFRTNSFTLPRKDTTHMKTVGQFDLSRFARKLRNQKEQSARPHSTHL